MSFLRQSTQVVVKLGPYLDKTDGVTEEVGLVGAGTEISKEPGAAFGAGPTLGTHDAEGWYPVTLTTTHTNTVGRLVIKGHDPATHLPVWHEFTVVEEAVYDQLFAASAPSAALVATTDTIASDLILLSTKMASDHLLLESDHQATLDKVGSDHLLLDSDHVKTQSDVALLSTKMASDHLLLDSDHVKTQSDVALLSTKMASDHLLLESDHQATLNKVGSDHLLLDSDHAKTQSDVALLSTKVASDHLLLESDHQTTLDRVSELDSALVVLSAKVASDHLLLESDPQTTLDRVSELDSALVVLSAKMASDHLLLDSDHAKTQSDVALVSTKIDSDQVILISDLALANLETAISELGQGIPSATPSTKNAIMLPYMMLRGKFTSTATTKKVHNDAGTVIAKSTISDDGTTFTDDKMVSCP